MLTAWRVSKGELRFREKEKVQTSSYYPLPEGRARMTIHVTMQIARSLLADEGPRPRWAPLRCSEMLDLHGSICAKKRGPAAAAAAAWRGDGGGSPLLTITCVMLPAATCYMYVLRTHRAASAIVGKQCTVYCPDSAPDFCSNPHTVPYP